MQPPGMPRSDSPHTLLADDANLSQPSEAHGCRAAATRPCSWQVLPSGSCVNDLQAPGGFTDRHADAHSAAPATSKRSGKLAESATLSSTPK